MSILIDFLTTHPAHFILPAHYQHCQYYCFRLGNDSDFAGINPNHTQAMIDRTTELLQQHNAMLGIGRYAEDRSLYQQPQFQQQQRTVHLGIDLTVPAGTPVFAPYAGVVHSVADHDQPGDYGPTLILQHRHHDLTFYTLYGHLDPRVLTLTLQQPCQPGDLIAHVGDEHRNGGWPPHLHFQIIHDMHPHTNDYPGVCCKINKQNQLINCPDPNLILQLPINKP